MLTENEAKTKWCPLIRVAADEDCNRNMPGTECIASDCMAWRWSNRNKGHTGESDQYGMPIEVPVFGWCGLAGRPEVE